MTDKRSIVTDERREILRVARQKSIEVRRANKITKDQADIKKMLLSLLERINELLSIGAQDTINKL